MRKIRTEMTGSILKQETNSLKNILNGNGMDFQRLATGGAREKLSRFAEIRGENRWLSRAVERCKMPT